jgi:hypothetical protein
VASRDSQGWSDILGGVRPACPPLSGLRCLRIIDAGFPATLPAGQEGSLFGKKGMRGSWIIGNCDTGIGGHTIFVAAMGGSE